MHYSRIALAATPILFTYVSAYGAAVIKNSCADDAYFWSCGDSPGDMITVPAGSSHSETYYSKQDGGGISLKIARKYSSGPKAGQIPGVWDLPAPNMTQFEYTVGTPGPPDHSVFYDISNINGYPFVHGGVKMTSSDDSVKVACPKDVQYCQAAYNAPHDDHATGSAPDHVDLTLELCSDAGGVTVGGSDSGSEGSSGGSDPVSSPESSSSSPAPVAASTSASSAAAQTTTAASQQQPEPQTQDKQAAPQVAAPEKLAVNAPEKVADVVIVHTVTAAPVVVTVQAKAKRHEHDHVHQHVHNKINKKRHGN